MFQAPRAPAKFPCSPPFWVLAMGAEGGLGAWCRLPAPGASPGATRNAGGRKAGT